MDIDGTDIFQERYDHYKEDTMAKPLGRIKAEDLDHGQRIIDPEGNEATVVRIQRIDHQRGRLTTDLGVAVVPLNQMFPVLP